MTGRRSDCRRWNRLRGALLAGGLALLPGAGTFGAGFGRLTGTVTDVQGYPLMGASVSVTGPVSAAGYRVATSAERVITDAHGEFRLERLVPGWYSIRVSAPTRLPVFRNGIRVEAGRSARQKFVLTDIFAPLRVQVPSSKVANWGEDWKWVLRSSSSTRPILRYQEVAQTKTSPERASRGNLPPTRRLIGMIPGMSRRDALGETQEFGSVLAYLRPLSDDSDVLVAGSMAAGGLLTSSLGTSFRKHVINGDPRELTLVVHQLSLSDGTVFATDTDRDRLTRAQGIVVDYGRTRRLTGSLTLTMGMEIDYLNSVRGVVVASPRVKLDYHVNPSSAVEVRYGTVRLDDGSNSLVDRVGMLSAFPRVTLRGFQPRLEELNHAEVNFHQNRGKNSRLEIAGFQDYFQNVVVRGLGTPDLSAWQSGNLAPNPFADGVFLNGGNYRSTGLRAAYSHSVGRHVDTSFVYAFGEALAVDPSSGLTESEAFKNLRAVLRPRPSRALTGKISSRIPFSNTQVATSYQWIEDNRVTSVDPYGEAELDVQPFLGVQIRQPLPNIGFLPARIEALADFRNLLGEGYMPVSQSRAKPFLLTSAYRSFRGGFSFQF